MNYPLSSIKSIWIAFSIFSLFVFAPQLAQSDEDKKSNQLSQVKPKLTLDQQRQWFNLAGKSYLEQPSENGGSIEILANRFLDGTYEFQFRTHDKNGGYKDSIEIGEWGISGDIYFTIFKGWIINDKYKKADARDPYNRDAYRIITLDEEEFVYESLDGKTRYSAKHVADSFVLKDRQSL